MAALNHVQSGHQLNNYPNFPFVGQVFAIQRYTINKKTGKETKEMAYGLISHSPISANAARILKFNREHWRVESDHYMLDWNWNEDRCTIGAGHGPENITCLRRFATGLIKSISKDSVAETIKKLARNVRRVFENDSQLYKDHILTLMSRSSLLQYEMSLK